MANQVEPSTSDVSDEDHSSVLRESLESLREDFKALKADLSVSGKEALRSLGDEAKEKGEAVYDASCDCVRKSPLMSVGIALGLGIFLGSLHSRG